MAVKTKDYTVNLAEFTEVGKQIDAKNKTAIRIDDLTKANIKILAFAYDTNMQLVITNTTNNTKLLVSNPVNIKYIKTDYVKNGKKETYNLTDIISDNLVNNLNAITYSSKKKAYIGTKYNDTFISTVNNETFTGGLGKNTYNYSKTTGGKDVINLTNNETLVLNLTDINKDEVILKYANKNKDLVLFIDDNNQITLKNFVAKNVVESGSIILNTQDQNNIILKDEYIKQTITTAVDYNGTRLNDHIDATLALEKTNKNGNHIDLLFKGGAGNDLIESSNYGDQLTGGTGTNTYKYTSLKQLEGDKITLTKGENARIDLSALNTTATYKVNGKNLEVTADGHTFTIMNFGTKDVTNNKTKKAADTSSVVLIDNSGEVDLRTVAAVTSDSGTYHNDFIDKHSYYNKKDKGLTIGGGAGNDTIIGTDYKDTIKAGTGLNEEITGGLGDDNLYASTTTNSKTTFKFYFADGNDTIYSGNGEDAIEFYSYNGVSYMSGADFTFTQGTTKKTRNDLIIKYSNNDTVTIKDYFKSTNTVKKITTSEGTFTIADIIETGIMINGTENDDNLIGTANAENINGLGGDDTINGLAGNDIINGGYGNDIIIGGAGNDTLYGGTGNNTYIFNAGDGADTIVDTSSGDTIKIDVNGAKNNIVLTSSEVDPSSKIGKLTVSGYGNGDSITINDFDFIHPANNIATIQVKNQEGTGYETLILADSIVVPVELINNQVYDATTIPYKQEISLEANATSATVLNLKATDNIILTGGTLSRTWSTTDKNKLTISNSEKSVIINDFFDDTDDSYHLGKLNGVNIYTAGMALNIILNDDVNNLALDNTFHSTITGTGKISGLTSNDKLQFESATTYSLTPAGLNVSDANSSITVTDKLSDDVSNVNVYVGNTADNFATKNLTVTEIENFSASSLAFQSYNITGTSSGEVITGGDGADTINGGDGADNIYGGGGNDTINGGNDYDTIYGGDGDDIIHGDIGRDVIYGNDGNDTIYGDNGRDTIYGGDGDDIIYGGDGNDDNDDIFTGKGNDTIYGGGGITINTILLDSGYKTIEIGPGSHNENSLYDIIVFINETDLDNLTGHVSGNDLIITDTKGTTAKIVNYFTLPDEYRGVHLQVQYKGGPGMDITNLPVIISSDTSEINGTKLNDDITATNNNSVIINGYSGNDTINSGSGNNAIDGGEGNDKINSSTGNDTINGGAGDDTINSGAGNDTIDGGDGKDLIDGGDGDDIIYGGYQDDTINGGTGNDTINAGTGTNTIIINSDNKTIVNGGGVDTLIFNNETNIDNLIASISGNDLIITNSNGNFAKLSGYFLKNHNIAAIKVGNKTTSIENLLSQIQDNIIIGTNNNDTLEGNAGDNIIYSRTGNDTINGGAGNNTLYLGTGNKTIINGGGVDTLILSDETDINKITASVSGNNLVIADGSGNFITLSEYFLGGHSVKTLKVGNASIVIEDLMFSVTSDELVINGTNFNDNIIATNASDLKIYGNAGNDKIYGNAGNDTIDGGDGDDTINGGNGNDTIIGGIGKDYIYGGDGNDTINGGNGNDVLYGNAGDDTIYSGSGNDIINGGEGNNTLYLDEGNKTIINGGGVDTLIFRNVADIDNITASASGNNLIITDSTNTSVTLKGYLTESDHNVSIFKVGDNTKNFDELKNSINSDNETITGTSFHDSITSTSGDRAYIYAGAGNDLIYVNASISHIEGGDGNDTIHGNNGWDNIQGGNGNDLIYGGGYGDNIQGGNGNDTIYGEAGADGISGDGGNDELHGDSGDDTINGGEGNDTIYGGNDKDTIDGGTGNDKIYGDAGNDDIEGGSGNDTIYGGAGNDIIKGSDGNDVLYGGEGNDKYIQKENNLADYDEIYDEAGNNDSLEINYNKNDIILRFDIEINGGGNIIELLSENMYITTVGDFGNTEKGVKIIEQFNSEHSIENIKTADNYTLSIDKINELRSNIATWLYNNGFAGQGVQEILESGDSTAIGNLIAEFQKADWQQLG